MWPLDNISSTAEPFGTKLGMVMHHHGPECRARRLFFCLRSRGHSQGSYNQIWLFLPYLQTADLFATKFKWMVHYHKLECLYKGWIIFKVKISIKVQNLIESLCILYLLYHWSLGNETRCADSLLLKTKPSTSGHILTVALWLTGSLDIQRGLFCRTRRQTLFLISFFLVLL